METKKEVKTIQVDYTCDKCGIGKMRPSGNVLTTYPPQYPHFCNNPIKCDGSNTFTGITYPYVDYVLIEEEKKEEEIKSEPEGKKYESVQHSMPAKTDDFILIEKPYKTWEDFFDEHAEGRRRGYQKGIDTRMFGYAGDVQVFWKSEEEFPFAYTYPATTDSNGNSGYFFYIKKNEEDEKN